MERSAHLGTPIAERPAGIARYACASFYRGRRSVRKLAVSGLPGRRGFRAATALRPNSMSRASSRRLMSWFVGRDSLSGARPIETGAVIERQHSRDNRSDGEISTCLGGEKLFYCGRVAEMPRCWDS